MLERIETIFPPYRADYVNQCVWDGKTRVCLTPKAFAVLKHLLQTPGQLVTKEKLLEAVWPQTFVSDAVLKVCIGEVRRALRDEVRAPRFIETAHRRGYRFIGDVWNTAANS
jgi:DNA-binding winged helix-turn-helix (wHTH) protein